MLTIVNSQTSAACLNKFTMLDSKIMKINVRYINRIRQSANQMHQARNNLSQIYKIMIKEIKLKEQRIN